MVNSKLMPFVFEQLRLLVVINNMITSVTYMEVNYYLFGQMSFGHMPGSPLLNYSHLHFPISKYNTTRLFSFSHTDQEDCLALYTRRQGYWNDQNCGTPEGRVCKRPVGSPRPSTPAPTLTPTATTTVTSQYCPPGWTAAPG